MIPRWLWSLSPAVAFGVAFFALTKFIRRTPITPRELSVDQALTARAPASLVDLSHAVNVQVWMVVVLALVVCLLLLRRFRQAVLLLLAEPLAEAINLALKIAINREMPDQGAVGGLDRLDVLLFPSGHVVRVTVSLGLFIAFLAWPHRRVRWLATGVVLAFIALVGVAQTTVGGHLPLDVVGGFLLGSVIVNVVYVVDRAWTTRGGSASVSLSIPMPIKLRRLMPAVSVCVLVIATALVVRAPQRLWHAASSSPSLSPSSLIALSSQQLDAAHSMLGRLRNRISPD